MFQKTGIFFIKLPMYQSVNLIYARSISLTKTSLTHLIKLANYMSFILQLSFIPFLNFIKVCRSNLDFLLYHPQGALSFVSCLFHAITQFEQFFDDGKRRRFHCTIFNAKFVQNFMDL